MFPDLVRNVELDSLRVGVSAAVMRLMIMMTRQYDGSKKVFPSQENPTDSVTKDLLGAGSAGQDFLFRVSGCWLAVGF